MTDPKMNREGIVGSSAEFDRLFGIDRKGDPKMNELAEKIELHAAVLAEVYKIPANAIADMKACAAALRQKAPNLQESADSRKDENVVADSAEIAAIQEWLNNIISPDGTGEFDQEQAIEYIQALLRALSAASERGDANHDSWIAAANERDELRGEIHEIRQLGLKAHDEKTTAENENRRLRTALRDAPDPRLEGEAFWVAYMPWYDRAREVLGDE